jgi:hypothetical protein
MPDARPATNAPLQSSEKSTASMHFVPGLRVGPTAARTGSPQREIGGEVGEGLVADNAEQAQALC